MTPVFSLWPRAAGRAAVLALGCSAMGLLAVGFRAPAGAAGRARSTAGDPGAASLARGIELYQRHCQACHGAEGRGDGDAAYLLSPKPRDFGSGRFRLVTAANGVPNDEDLLNVLKRGMPGSAMPPWNHLTDQQLRDLVTTVREFMVRGRAQDLLRIAAEEDEELSEAEALAQAREAFAPAQPLPELPVAPATPASLERGRALYLKNCAECHGEDGRGLGVKEQWNEDGTPNQPRDFTAGILKGNWEAGDLTCRILLGMPGSPMPAATLDKPEDSALIATYVRSLIRPGEEEKVLQRRTAIRAPRCRAVPSDPADSAWNQAPETYLALMPLWWRNERIAGVNVRALHDGERLAIRMSWSDGIRDQDLLSQAGFSDAAAVQFSGAADPPLFTMGAAGEPVHILLWKAGWEVDRERAWGVADLHPDTPPDLYPKVSPEHHALYLTANAVGNLQAAARHERAAEDLSAEGFSTLESQPAASQDVEARGTWAANAWSVVLLRPLRAVTPEDVALRPGTPLNAAFAVWDGAAGDRNGQKSVTIWHSLDLQP